MQGSNGLNYEQESILKYRLDRKATLMSIERMGRERYNVLQPSQSFVASASVPFDVCTF